MIAFIQGTIDEITENSVIIENNGIGYEIFMTGSSIDRFLAVGKQMRIYTHYHVREDAAQLYGFVSKDELRTFGLLLTINGIGPKAALGILSAVTPDELRFAILSDDVKTLAKAPGVGKKTAQKMILELKDKVSLEEAFEAKLTNAAEQGDLQQDLADDQKQEAVEALVALGYSSTEALRAVRKVTDAKDVESILREALKNM